MNCSFAYDLCFTSHSADVEGRDEVSLQYNDIEQEGASTRSAGLRRAKAEVFKCCNGLAERGYALTLIVSRRALLLFVRSEEVSATPKAPARCRSLSGRRPVQLMFDAVRYCHFRSQIKAPQLS
jgi:hypothetical protein